MIGQKLLSAFALVRATVVKGPRIILTAARKTVNRILSQDQRLYLRPATSTTLRKIAPRKTSDIGASDAI